MRSCECGNLKIIQHGNLLSGNTVVSCGCKNVVHTDTLLKEVKGPNILVGFLHEGDAMTLLIDNTRIMAVEGYNFLLGG